MIVERYTWVVKPGRRQDLIQWCKELVGRKELKDYTTRIYSTSFGARNNVVLEVEYETEESRLEYWAGIEWTPESTEFLNQHHDMIEGLGQTRELLNLH